MRCSPRATEPGDSTWITRSTAPMSMPSSSELVATIARSVPPSARSSISSRCSRAIEPWCARDELLAGELVETGGQPLGQPAARCTNTIVERCARISSSSCGWIAGQIDCVRRRGPSSPSIAGIRCGVSELARASAMSSTGTTTSISIGLRWPASTIVTGRGPARPSGRRGTARSPRAAAGSPTGRSAAAARCASSLEPFEREREVRAALGPGHRVDLVDDDPPDAPQDLARREVSIR